MRPWQEYIASNQSILSDFTDWAKGAEDTLSAETAKALRSGDIDSARKMAYKSEVYAEIRKAVERNIKERAAKMQFEEGRK